MRYISSACFLISALRLVLLCSIGFVSGSPLDAAPRSLDPDSRIVPFAGPGLDHTSWNGAMLVGPRGSIWGIRVGYKHPGGDYISEYKFYEKVLRAGPYSADGSYAQIASDDLTITWVTNSKDEVFGKVKVNKDLSAVVVEAYPAHDFFIRNQKPDPAFNLYFRNPCKFEIAASAAIIGTSPAILTTAGDTTVTGGHAIFSNRTERILEPGSGLDHFRLQAFPVPTRAGIGLIEMDTWGARMDTSRIGCLIYEKLKAGEVIYARARVSQKAVSSFSMAASAIERRICKDEQKYEAGRLHGTGVFGKAVEPMCNEALWVKTYNPFEKTTWLTLGRHWQADGRYNVWGWDENFGAVVAAQFSGQDAWNNLLIAAGDERVGPLAAWSAYLRHPDKGKLSRVYRVYRNLYHPTDAELVRGGGDRNGNVGKGMDDTPMREHWIKMGEMYSLDMSSMKAWSVEFLARMAGELGFQNEESQYSLTHQRLLEKINRTFWNEEKGIYRNRYLSGEWPVTEGPTSFYPWLAGAPSSSISDRLLQQLLNPSKFWGDYVIVSLAKDDPQYGKQATEPGWDGKHFYPPYCYWRGNVWAPPTYMVYEGLKRYEMDEVAAEYAKKCVNIWWKNWESKGWSPENHNPESGMRSEMAHSHYIWGNLMPLIGVKEMIDIEPWGEPGVLRFGSMSADPSSIRNWRWLGHNYDVTIGNGATTLHRDGDLVFKALGGPCVVRHFKPGGITTAPFLVSSTNTIRIEVRSAAPGHAKILEVPAGRHRIVPSSKAPVQPMKFTLERDSLTASPELK